MKKALPYIFVLLCSQLTAVPGAFAQSSPHKAGTNEQPKIDHAAAAKAHRLAEKARHDTKLSQARQKREAAEKSSKQDMKPPVVKE